MAVNMYREYRLKFYLNMRHYIIINEVKGETHPHTWEFALDIKFSRNLFVEFNIFEHGISQFLEQYQNKILNEAGKLLYFSFSTSSPIRLNNITA